MRDPRRLEGPFLIVFADAERPPLRLVMPLVDRTNRVREMLGLTGREMSRTSGHLVPDEELYLWQVENDSPEARMLPVNPWLIDRIRGPVFFSAASYEPLTAGMVRWIKANLLRP